MERKKLAYLIIRTIKPKEEVVQFSVSDVLALLPQCRSQPGQTFLGETLYWFVWEWPVCTCVYVCVCVRVYVLYSARSAYRFKSTSPTIPASITLLHTCTVQIHLVFSSTGLVSLLIIDFLARFLAANTDSSFAWFAVFSSRLQIICSCLVVLVLFGHVH